MILMGSSMSPAAPGPRYGMAMSALRMPASMPLKAPQPKQYATRASGSCS